MGTPAYVTTVRSRTGSPAVQLSSQFSAGNLVNAVTIHVDFTFPTIQLTRRFDLLLSTSVLCAVICLHATVLETDSFSCVFVALCLCGLGMGHVVHPTVIIVSDVALP